MVIFLYYGRFSSAQLDRWQAPTQWPIIEQLPVEQTAYRLYPSLQILGWYVKGTGLG